MTIARGRVEAEFLGNLVWDRSCPVRPSTWNSGRPRGLSVKRARRSAANLTSRQDLAVLFLCTSSRPLPNLSRDVRVHHAERLVSKAHVKLVVPVTSRLARNQLFPTRTPPFPSCAGEKVACLRNVELQSPGVTRFDCAVNLDPI